MKCNHQILINTFCIVLLHVFIPKVFTQSHMPDNQMYHLRSTDQPEWTGFPGEAIKQLILSFDAEQNTVENTLKLTQKDVRQNWRIIINGTEIGKLDRDDSRRVKYFTVLPQLLKQSNNQLIIEQVDTTTDDISVGELTIEKYSIQELLAQAKVSVSVLDKKASSVLPCKITIVDSNGALQPFNIVKNKNLVARTGCLYTANGKATFTLPPGKYTIYANRGFEYSADSVSVMLAEGDSIEKKLVIEKEVPTNGWIASDTHIHTYTYSLHGDATMQERVVTIAGEGIELPAITEHNKVVDVDSMARSMGVREYFTPVIGDEYTTAAGHFNVFPLMKNAKAPVHTIKDWNDAVKNLDSAGKETAIILNHARDEHNNFRPFDPQRHVSIAGMELDNSPFPGNAMEVMNSGSQQKDIMQLFYDWFGMLNGGKQLTPVGSSDSHDVSRFLVGQSRTYIKYADDEPGKIDVRKATDEFLKGKVMVSFGLLTEIKVNENYGPGDLVPAFQQIKIDVRVLGPGWVKADKVYLFANGKKIREAAISKPGDNGVKWSGSWVIPVPRQDIFLVAIADGPGPSAPFWQIPNPYQRTSPEWDPKIIGATGAVWIDGDKDGKKTTAFDYANKVIAGSHNDLSKIMASLARYDEAVNVEAAAILYKKGLPITSQKFKQLLIPAAPVVQKGFKAFGDNLPGK
jgi:hypothetical protein